MGTKGTKSVFESEFVVSVRVDVSGDNRTAQGIHLHNPTEREVEQAIELAQRDLFPTVWVHWDNVVCLDPERSKRKAG